MSCRPLPQPLLHRVAVGPIRPLFLVGETKAPDAGVWEASTAGPGDGDGIAHAAVSQPAPITAVQLGELPR